MFSPNSLKYKGFYYNLDAFAMDIVNEFYIECARYINISGTGAASHSPVLTEKDNLLYSVINDPSVSKRYTLDPGIVGFNLVNNLVSNKVNLNSSTFSMGLFRSVNKLVVLQTFSNYESANGKSATSLGSRFPLWVKSSIIKELFENTDFVWDSFLVALLFALENLYYSIKSVATGVEMQRMSFDKFLIHISPPIDILKKALSEVGFSDGVSIPDYYSLPLVCYQTVMQVFLMGKYSLDESSNKINVFLASVDNMLLHRLGQEFKQKEPINAMCALTARFLISEIASRGFTPSADIFENVLTVCQTSNKEDAALFLFANSTLAAKIGADPAVPYTSMRLVDSTQGKTDADKAYDARAAVRATQLAAAANAQKAKDCAESVAQALAARDAAAAAAAASATAAARTVNAQRDAAATPGVLTTIPPTTATGGSTNASGAVGGATAGAGAGAGATAGTNTSTSTNTTAAAPTPTSTLNAGNAATDLPTGFTPRTRFAMRIGKQSEWEGLNNTQLAAYNNQMQSEYLDRSKSNFDAYALSLQAASSLSNHTAALMRPLTEMPTMLTSAPAASSKGAGRYKSSFSDKDLTKIVYQ